MITEDASMRKDTCDDDDGFTLHTGEHAEQTSADRGNAEKVLDSGNKAGNVPEGTKEAENLPDSRQEAGNLPDNRKEAENMPADLEEAMTMNEVVEEENEVMSATQLREAPSKEDKIEEEQKTSIDTLKLQESRSVSLHTVNLPRGMSSASEMKEEEEEKQTELIPERAGKDEKSAPIETIA